MTTSIGGSTAPLPELGSTVKAKLGNATVDVVVTNLNQGMLRDGDLSDNLGTINAKDGDAKTLTVNDFKTAGFSSTEAASLFKAAGALHIPSTLKASDQNKLTAVIGSKPYLAAGVSGTTPATMTAFLKSLTPVGRNGILSEVSTEVGMLKVRDKALVDLKAPLTPTGATKEKAVASLLGKGPAGASLNDVLKYMGANLKDPKSVAAFKAMLQDAILKSPDMSLGDKHEALERAGVTDLGGRNTLIQTSQAAIWADIKVEAQAVFATLGGTGDIPETLTLSTGDGTGTNGVCGERSLAIGYLQYGQGTGTGQTKGTPSFNTVQGVETLTTDFRSNDPTKPTALHLSGMGVNHKGSDISLTQGGQTFTFKLVLEAGQTKLVSVPDPFVGKGGVKYDPKTQTLTFPPSSKPITLTQASKDKDEVMLNVTGTNLTGSAPDVSLDLARLFEPDSFAIDPTKITPEDLAEIDKVVAYLVANPDVDLTTVLAGLGPVDDNGSPTPELTTGYGPEGSATSRTQLADQRSSTLEVDFSSGKINVTSTTDPIPSNLTTTKGRLSPKGVTFANDLKKSNPGIKDNHILSAGRAFALLEFMQQRLESKGVHQDLTGAATVMVGKTPVDYTQYTMMKPAPAAP